LPPRVLQRTRILEHPIQFPIKRELRKWTKAIAYADDLLIAVRAATIEEVENYTNMEMIKISKWSKENKLLFNDKKSKVLLISMRKEGKN